MAVVPPVAGELPPVEVAPPDAVDEPPADVGGGIAVGIAGGGSTTPGGDDVAPGGGVDGPPGVLGPPVGGVTGASDPLALGSSG